MRAIAFERFEDAKLTQGLDALGDDDNVERVGEPDDRRDDGAFTRSADQVMDEGLVDLDEVERNCRRYASAE